MFCDVALSTIFWQYSFFVFLMSCSVVFLRCLAHSTRRMEGVWKCLIHPCMCCCASQRSVYALDSSGVHQGLDLLHILCAGTALFAVFSSSCCMNSIALSSSSGIALCFSGFRYSLTICSYSTLLSSISSLRVFLNSSPSACFQFSWLVVGLVTVWPGLPTWSMTAWWSDREPMLVSM